MNPTSSAPQSGEAVQASSAQDEPNYKALYTDLKGEVLEKVGPCAEIAHRLREHRQLMWSGDVKPGVPKCQLVPLDLLNDAIRALSSLHEKIGGSSDDE